MEQTNAGKKSDSRWVFASSNAGKIQEVHSYLSAYKIQILPQSCWQIADIDETGLSFVENAILKARYAAQQSGLPALADDSGLMIDALQGRPGIYSARYAGEAKSFGANIEKVLAELHGVAKAQRSARFVSVMVLIQHATDPLPVIFQGVWEGEILFQPQGTQGFGYDPIFYVPTHQCSAAELSLAVKNQISHRGQALLSLLKYSQKG